MESKLKAQLRRRIKKHVEAQVALSWVGSADPKDMKYIEEESSIRRNQLNEFIRSLTLIQED